MPYAPTFGEHTTLPPPGGSSGGTMSIHGNSYHTSNFITIDGIPLTSSSDFGLSKVDGTTIEAADGVISVVSGSGGMITSPGSSVDREILIWDGVDGDAIITPSNANISSIGTISAGADVIAYQTVSPTGSYWDNLPTATSTTIGGFILDATQMEMNAGVLSILDGVLTPKDHEHSWADITSGTQPDPVAHSLTSATYHTVSGLTTGHYLKATAADAVGFGTLAASSVDHEILRWDGATGNIIHTASGVVIDDSENILAGGDVMAYQDGVWAGSVWDGIPHRYSVEYTGGYLQLEGETTSTPGNNKFYGTNGSGVKGWYTPSGTLSSWPPVGIVVSTGTGWDSSITNNSANWNTAYGWGDWSATVALKAPIANPTFTGTVTTGGHIVLPNDYGIFAKTAGGTLLGIGFDTDSDNSLRLYTNATEKVRITSAGLVGIGTGTPTFEGGGNYGLHIHNTASASNEVHLTNGATGSASTDGFSVELGSTGVAYVWNQENTNLVFATNDTARVTIQNDGLVGIGTSTPGQTITLNHAAAAPGIGFRMGDSAYGYVGVAYGTNDWITGATNGQLCIRSQGYAIKFSADSGTTAQMILSTAGRLSAVGDIVAYSS